MFALATATDWNSRTLPEAGTGPCNARIAGTLNFFFLCKPIATLHRGIPLRGNILGHQVFDHSNSRMPLRISQWNNGTRPSHIPCPDLVSQTRMFFLVFYLFDSGRLWTWLLLKPVSCSDLKLWKWYGFDGRIANPGLFSSPLSRDQWTSSRQGLPLALLGIGSKALAVITSNVLGTVAMMT